jgi:hypothetical protein
MFNSVVVLINQRLHPASLNNIYRHIVKLEWFAIVGLLVWLLVLFSMILT